MDLSAILFVFGVALLKAVAFAGVVFWSSLVTFTFYPPLGQYLVKLLDFKK
jgi:hypothetical protein